MRPKSVVWPPQSGRRYPTAVLNLTDSRLRTMQTLRRKNSMAAERNLAWLKTIFGICLVDEKQALRWQTNVSLFPNKTKRGNSFFGECKGVKYTARMSILPRILNIV